MDRAFVGDFQQPFTLLGVEQAFDFDFALDLVDLIPPSSRSPDSLLHESSGGVT